MQLSKQLDPRHYQLAVQTSLLVWGIWMLGFPVTGIQVAAVLLTAMAVQMLACRLLGLPNVWLSSLNSSLSVLLLLHAQGIGWLMVAAAVSTTQSAIGRPPALHGH